MQKRWLKYWAVKKWQWIVDNWDYSEKSEINYRRMSNDIPRLDYFLFNCSFCEEYSFNCFKINKNLDYDYCPLSEDCFQCCKNYDNWEDNKEDNPKKARKYAKLLLEQIKNL